MVGLFACPAMEQAAWNNAQNQLWDSGISFMLSGLAKQVPAGVGFANSQFNPVFVTNRRDPEAKFAQSRQ
jgi:hypothetical protein